MNVIQAPRLRVRFAMVVSAMLGALVCVAETPDVATAPPETARVKLPEGINARFTDPELKPEEFVDRFEQDGREAFAARAAIMQATGVKPGMRVADIGAGTGLFTVLFSESVGPEGWVYAVDISPKFIEHIASRADEAGIENITPVLCDANSANLPPESVDVAYVCDTYHHFEFPSKTNASIFRAVKPGGTLVVVDFIRDPATSSEWLLNHVRASKEVFRSEIEAAGFELVDEPEVEGLRENYLLVFRKP
ncbi:class I SAM-dependent methyltransferase [Aeoliella mucimassa]|uniref:Demethylmenaquinone methyltransferase n=1 Tax=Aeoliella mucimassa TaxID=2527972 RepID=A0A518AWP8_9BACT|nr:methyltransferase domain-containing protein [Aeoliella mucimassa]QDU59136.1 Demethylmenaquinone methyltransferase [Aeoliella mucimassa]